MSSAQNQNARFQGLGQTIEINTRFQTFEGAPIWTLIIRDVDHNQNIPYSFDIRRGQNVWIVPTHGRNYLITASRLQIPVYQSRYNRFKNYRIKNFCQLESNGRIVRAESMRITITGDLSIDANNYHCHIITFPGPTL